MKVNLFNIGGFHVRGYGFMIGIGFLVAIVIGMYRARKLKLNDESVIDLALLCGVLGFAGAKVLYIFTVLDQFKTDPLSVLGSAGFVVYGGIISGVIVAIVYCRIKKYDFWDYFDLILPEISVAQGFGRIGCFLAGCCYGRHTDSFIGVVFPKGSMAPAGVKLIPTQLFSAAGDFLIATILMMYAKKAKKKGDVGSLYMILYGIGRFIIECFRNDERGAVGFLSTSQFISIFIVAFGIGIMVYMRKRKDATAQAQTVAAEAQTDSKVAQDDNNQKVENED